MEKVVPLFKPFKPIFYFKIFKLENTNFGAKHVWFPFESQIHFFKRKFFFNRAHLSFSTPPYCASSIMRRIPAITYEVAMHCAQAFARRALQRQDPLSLCSVA
jgi:hypothetical protein